MVIVKITALPVYPGPQVAGTQVRGRGLIYGAVAQLGERMTGSHEVRGSTPLSSTRPRRGTG